MKHKFYIVLSALALFHSSLSAEGLPRRPDGFRAYFQLREDFTHDVPSWMKEQICEDLAPFVKSGIKKTDLDDLMENQKKCGNNYFLIRFTINNNQVSVYHHPTDHCGVLAIISILTDAFNKLAKIAPIPDVDFLVSALDCLDGVNLSVPIFSFANDPTYSSNIVLMPDFGALSGHENFLKGVGKGNALYPWESKINQVMWRGAMTGYPFEESLTRVAFIPPRMGGVFTVENFLDFPRTRAISLSLRFPHLISARYTTVCQCIDCNDIQSQFAQYFDHPLPIDQQLQYKYQLLVDGNTAAYSRAYWQLFSNCVIIKQDSDAVQWYFRALRPYTHYIPVRTDLSNLVDVVHWAIQHDDLAQKISAEAQNFALYNLTHFHVMQYMYLLLTEYARLQK